MKRLSVTMKLTLWYGAFMLLSFFFVGYVFSRSAGVAADRYYRQELKQAASLAVENASFENGYLEFEEMPGAMEHVHVSYFMEDGGLLYGHVCASAPLLPGQYTKAYDDYERHRYILDEAFELSGYGRVLIRASISMEDADAITDQLPDVLFFLLPALLLISLAGGFVLSRRAMRPVKRITETARQITGGQDLEKRIPVLNASDEMGRLAGVINDMLMRLSRSFEREKRFTGDVSHELRTPVAAILSLSEEALMEGATMDEKNAAISKVHDKSLEMSRMIKNLLMLSRIDAGKLGLQIEKADLSDIAEAIVSQAIERYPDQEAFIHHGFSPAECGCDPMMIAQLIMNLTENACCYTPKGGRIEIETGVSSGGAFFKIKNFGIGLAPGEEKTIFDRFYRANRARNDGGHGLGLSIAKAIADAHGASLTCDSKENDFVCFTLTMKNEK